jgi:murein DD-endopeptidase MepM/ murein hydrolase activator NlpD
MDDEYAALGAELDPPEYGMDRAGAADGVTPPPAGSRLQVAGLLPAQGPRTVAASSASELGVPPGAGLEPPPGRYGESHEAISPGQLPAIGPGQRPPEWDDWNTPAQETYTYLSGHGYAPETARDMAWRMQLYGAVDRPAPIGPAPGAVPDAQIAREMPPSVSSLGADAQHDYVQLRQMGWTRDQASHAIVPGPINPITGTAGFRDVPDGRTGNLRPGLVEGSGNFRARPTRPHEGIDIAAPLGTPVQAANTGRVVWKGSIKGYGNTVIVDQDDGYQTLYGHLDSYANNLKLGQRVVMGDTLGLAGHTGNAGYVEQHPAEGHLHFGVRPLPAKPAPAQGDRFADPAA